MHQTGLKACSSQGHNIQFCPKIVWIFFFFFYRPKSNIGPIRQFNLLYGNVVRMMEKTCLELYSVPRLFILQYDFNRALGV